MGSAAPPFWEYAAKNAYHQMETLIQNPAIAEKKAESAASLIEELCFMASPKIIRNTVTDIFISVLADSDTLPNYRERVHHVYMAISGLLDGIEELKEGGKL